MKGSEQNKISFLTFSRTNSSTDDFKNSRYENELLLEHLSWKKLKSFYK